MSLRSMSCLLSDVVAEPGRHPSDSGHLHVVDGVVARLDSRRRLACLAVLAAACGGLRRSPAVHDGGGEETGMLELYHSGLTTCSKQVRHCLREKGLPYRSRYVELWRYENLSPAYLELN